MKKVLAIALALVLVLALAACGGEKAPEVLPYEGEISAVITTLNEANPVEFMRTDAMPVDLTDSWVVKSVLGLGDGESPVTGGDVTPLGVKEAFYSESPIGAQAYSLVIARVDDVEKIEEVKKAMFDGIDMRKWICVEADQLRVVSSSDVILLVMASSELAPEITDKMVETFKTAVGELSGETLSETQPRTADTAQ